MILTILKMKTGFKNTLVLKSIRALGYLLSFIIATVAIGDIIYAFYKIWIR
ncbi:hypothetical protein CLU81_0567 [Flavobacterium sp. 9]|nr:hypothetical protein CLU81_0567 [Flavobacterium sp. 9]